MCAHCVAVPQHQVNRLFLSFVRSFIRSKEGEEEREERERIKNKFDIEAIERVCAREGEPKGEHKWRWSLIVALRLLQY